MFLNSLKQLFRRPGKALIFFLLLAAATALLTFASVSMTETNQRIDAAESQFSTVATVSLDPAYGDRSMTVDVLNFEGAEFVSPPETRPYYLARVPEARDNGYTTYALSVHIVEFTAIDDSITKSKLEPMKVRIDKVHYEAFEDENYTIIGVNYHERRLEPGDEVYIIQTYADAPNRFEAGKAYIGNLEYQRYESGETGLDIFSPMNAPYSTLYDPSTLQKLEDTIFPETPEPWCRCDEITDDFWEPGGLGDAWMEWVEQIKTWDRHFLPVIPTNDVQLLPTFHAKNAYMDRGREITTEEFASGAKVCMISDTVALGGVKVGDKISLSMQLALYGYQPDHYDTFEFTKGYIGFKPLDAQGKPLQAFFEDEYEVVGIYRQMYPGSGELYGEAVIVPAKSITASDENNIVYYSLMNDWSTSFRIPNGKIAEFNTALHNAVPEASRLEIIYDDNGYEDIMQSLKNARLSAMLLLAVGALAALTVIVLLIYFFVFKERKRTAIERSLGLSKSQCRVSLMSGILVLAVPAVVLGSWVSWAMSDVEFSDKYATADSLNSSAEPVVGELSISETDESMETAYFSCDYSLWAENENSETDITLDDTAVSLQRIIYYVIPISIFSCVLILAILIINHNLRIEPILLLGGHGE